jgi:hypothetical protein
MQLTEAAALDTNPTELRYPLEGIAVNSMCSTKYATVSDRYERFSCTVNGYALDRFKGCETSLSLKGTAVHNSVDMGTAISGDRKR